MTTPCALHDSHNAFRLGFLEECKDRGLMRDIYIAVESLRNSADLLSSRIGSWVFHHLVHREGRSPEWLDQRRVLLEALDVQPELLEIMMDIELAWEGDELCVRAGAQVDKSSLVVW